MSGLFLFLVVGVIVAVGCVLSVAQARIREHGLHVLLWRWHTGNTWHGQAVTDAGWRRPGTKALTPTGHAPRFHHRPRLHRAVIRSVPTAALLLAVVCLFLSGLLAALVMLAAEVAAAIGFGGWRTVRWVRLKKHHRTWVHPAALVAAPLAGHAPAADPRWLEVAPDRSRVKATLAPNYNGDAKQKERLVETLTSKLGMPSADPAWNLAGPSPFLELTASQPPPAEVRLADVRDILDRLPADAWLWGLGRRLAEVTTSLSSDSPHVGLSMGSGAGKSRTVRSLLAQMLHKGSIGLVLDYKKLSQMWVKGLPNVAVMLEPAKIHAALVWLGEEMERRNNVAYWSADLEGNVHADVGPRIIVVCEELNSTIQKLRVYWRQVRQKGDPERSPALDALDAVSFMGRQVRVNLIYIGQRLSDKATGGGGDARENIGVIALARWRVTTWKMLAPDFPPPPKNLTPGRLQVVSDRVQEVQGINMTAVEARELAMSGVVALLPSGMPGAPRATGEPVSRPQLDGASDVGVHQFQRPFPASPVSRRVTLSEAHREGVFGLLTLDGARTLRHRDPVFPGAVGRRGIALEYDMTALTDYAATRKD